jgi:hypothetical protein
VPRRINTLCSRVLLLGLLEENHLLDRRHVERVADELRRELEFQGTGKPVETEPKPAPMRVPEPEPEAMPASVAVTPTEPPAAGRAPSQDLTSTAETSSAETPLLGDGNAASPVVEMPDSAMAEEIAALKARLAVIERGLAKQDQTLEQHAQLLRQALSVATTLLDLGRD